MNDDERVQNMVRNMMSCSTPQELHDLMTATNNFYAKYLDDLEKVLKINKQVEALCIDGNY